MSDNIAGAPASAAPIENAAPAVENEQPSLEAANNADPAGATLEGQPKPAEVAKEQKKLEKQLKKFKLKVDGEEIDDEIDLSDEKEVSKRLQLAKVAQKRMAEAAEMRKSAEEFINILKTDPRRILSDPNIGIDLKKFAADIINEEIEEQKKSPEQREREKLQKELEDLREKAKKEEEGRKQAEFQRLQNEAFNKIDMDITEALKTENLPKKPYVLKKFADLMSIALQNDIDLSAKDVAPLVRKQILEDIQEMMGAAPEEVIEDLLGKEIMGKLRKRNLAKARQVAPSANNIKPTGSNVKPQENQGSAKKISMKDFLKG